MNISRGGSFLNNGEMALPALQNLTCQNLSFVHTPPQQVANGSGFYYFFKKGRRWINRKRVIHLKPQNK
jgi:hypothetical protein